MKQTTRILSTLVLAFALLPTPRHLTAKGLTPDIPLADPELSGMLRSLLEEDQYAFPPGAPAGRALTVSVPGLGLWSGAAGFSSVGDGLPVAMRSDAPFRIASITKTFVAAVVLQLDQEGVLSIEDPLDIWVPATFAGEGITLRHLLEHTSGVPDYYAENPTFLSSSQPFTVDEILAVVAVRPLHFSPGSQWSYSNTGYLLLGEVILSATGSSWSSEVRRRLLEPLDLRDTFVPGYDGLPEDMVRGYRWGDSWEDVTAETHPVTAGAAGGMLSNTIDTLRWLEALFGGAVLDPEQLELMMTPSPASVRTIRSLGFFLPAGFGLGLQTFVPGARVLYGHTGGLPGFESAAFYVPSHNAGSTLFLNWRTNDYPNPVRAMLQHCEREGCACVGDGGGVPDECGTGIAPRLKFSERERFEVGRGVQLNRMTSGDIDRDGDLDVVALDLQKNVLTVLRNNGQGELEVVEQLECGEGLADACLADLSGDAYPDLVVVESEANTVSIFVNDKGESFARHERVSHPVVAGPHTVVSLDLDGTGNPDLAGLSSTGGWFLTSGSLDAGSWSDGVELVKLEAADLDGDGADDLVGLSVEADAIHVFSADKTSQVVLRDRVPVAAGTTSFTTAHLDDDAVLDIVTLQSSKNSVCIYQQETPGVYERTAYLASGAILSSAVQAQDLDGDGRTDLLISEAQNPLLIYRMNLGNGEFAAPQALDLGRSNRPGQLHVIDLDGRSGPEIVWPWSRWVAFVRNETSNPTGRAGEESIPFVRGDCNSDGSVAGTVTDALFLLRFNFLGGGQPACLAACDADGSGEVDGAVLDAVYLLNFSFLGGPAPAPPYPECGGAEESDALLSCGSSLCEAGSMPPQ